jgi:amino acid adenylation domain-containing protein
MSVSTLERSAQINAKQLATVSPEELIDFPTLFQRQLALTPDNISMVFEGKSFSYKALDELSEQFKLSVLFHKKQTGNLESQPLEAPEICIGICVDKSPQAIAAMLGVLKAGAAFVPLDPEYPIDRIAFMVEDAAISTIIAQDNHQANIAPYLEKQFNKQCSPSSLNWISSADPTSDIADTTNLSTHSVVIKPSDLAYIMYTSGSTGKPKGVQIEHAALATYCYADIERYQVTAEDRTLQFSTINFDIAIEEIFPPLLVGGSIVIRPSERSDKLNELSAIINENQITAVHIATAYWHEWVNLMIASEDQIPPSLRLMVVTGEKVSTTHYQHWKTLCKLSSLDILWCNAYGPTEATVSASVFIPSEDFQDDNMPIGKPLKRYTAMIVDEDYIELPVGETGQLLIGGPALARGYLNRPELNKEVFIDSIGHAKNKTTQRYQLERMYKTGDLARWLPNGDIEFAGRIDHQIKLGSYRIEPGEIESVINHHPKVLESLVSYTEVNTKKTLVSYIAVGQTTFEQESLNASEIREYLDNRLPPYMVPSLYILVPSFPKTTNGKIDRKALPEPSAKNTVTNADKILPRNDLEKKLVSIWQMVLNLPEIGVHDDFFALGGSSLLAVGIVSCIVADLNLELPVRDFFANPTIATQARHINGLLKLESGQQIASDDQASQDSLTLRQRLPQIEPVYIKRDNERIFGVHYRPQNNQQFQSHAVLICPPLGHEYSRSHRNLQQLALNLGQAGFNSFRFDYIGTGNSSGSAGKALESDYIDNIRAAAEYIRANSQCQKLSIIAIRMGTPLAVSADISNLENLILWDPVVKGSHYINLLEGFHDAALSNLERFRIKRKPSATSELYGYSMSLEQKENLLKIEMPFIKAINNGSDTPRKQVLITSENYQLNEPGRPDLLDNCESLNTSDEIHWHNRMYSESAFSSPQTFKGIIEVLAGEQT